MTAIGFDDLAPPEPEEPSRIGDDPREFILIPIDRLVLDSTLQRETNLERSARMSNEWSWLPSEVVTVVRMTDGTFLVVDGQHRLIALRLGGYKGKVPCAVLPPGTSRQMQAAIARDLSRGTKRHSPYEDWRLAVQAGFQHEVAAESLLLRHGLRMGKSPSAHTIACVDAIRKIIYADRRTPELGVELLDKVLTTIEGAYDSRDPDSYNARFDRRIVRAVAEVYRRNGNVEVERFIVGLRTRMASVWISQAMVAPDAAWSIMGQRMVETYNRHLRSSERRLTW